MADSGISHPTLPFDVAEPAERWLPVAEWEDLYEVSSLGRVRSLRHWTATGFKGGKILRAFPEGLGGYLAVNLARGTRRERIAVHRIVARAFTGECPEGEEVRHGPNGKLDNRASQLCYGTRDQQAEDKVRDGTDSVGVRNGRARLTEDDVRDIRAAYVGGTTQVALAAQYGLTQASVSALLLRKTWRHVA